MENWTLDELAELMIDLPSLLKLMDEPEGNDFSVWIESGRNSGRRRVVYSRAELDRLRRMARAAGGRVPRAAPAPRDEARIVTAHNRLLKRGAAMHTTIALNRPERIDSRPTSGSLARWEGTVRFNDGRQVGLDGSANQWRFTRRLLDLMTPSPSSDSAVRDWYRASCAVLLRDFHLYPDPFWTYYSAAGRDADALLAQAYRGLSAD